MRVIWYIALATAVVALLASFGLEWKSVKEKRDEESEEAVEKNGQSERAAAV